MKNKKLQNEKIEYIALNEEEFNAFLDELNTKYNKYGIYYMRIPEEKKHLIDYYEGMIDFEEIFDDDDELDFELFDIDEY